MSRSWRTVLLVMQRDLAARRRAALVVTLITVALAVGSIALVALLTEGQARGLRGEDADRVLAAVGTITLFMALVFTGQIITEGVAEEKRSRVVEVVLGSVSPRQLLVGKIAAVGVVGLAEVAIICGAVAAAGVALDAFRLPRATTGVLLAVLGWFVLGFAFYATVYGAAGAMVAPHENPANGALPVNLLLMVGYMGGLTAQSGHGPFIQVLSLLPPTAPLTMPLRIAFGDAAWWEAALSAVLLVVAAFAMIRLAGRLYTGALMRSGKVRWRDAWRDAAHLG